MKQEKEETEVGEAKDDFESEGKWQIRVRPVDVNADRNLSEEMIQIKNQFKIRIFVDIPSQFF